MLAALVLSLAAQAGSPTRSMPPPRAAGRPPSLTLIVLDDVGWTEREQLDSVFGPCGLAARGTTLTRMYAQPLCSPSRLALLTGMLGRRIRMGGNVLDCFDLTTPELPDLDTLPEALLTGGGYESALFGKWHLGWASSSVWGRAPEIAGPRANGFQRWLAGNPMTPSLGPGASGYYQWLRVDDDVMELSTQYAVDAQVEEFLGWWSSSSAAPPQVAWVNLSAAHDPWDDPPGDQPVPQTLREQYEQVVEYADAAVAEIVSAIDLSRDYVIFTTDNGVPSPVRPVGTIANRWKFTTWEGGVRVPFVIAGPGITPGFSSSRLAQLTDVPATIAELLGVPFAGPDARSFADELGAWAGSAPRTFAFAERWSPIYDDQAIIEADWKLRRVDPDGTKGLDPTRNFFYGIDHATGFEDTEVDVPLEVRARLIAELASLPSRTP